MLKVVPTLIQELPRDIMCDEKVVLTTNCTDDVGGVDVDVDNDNDDCVGVVVKTNDDNNNVINGCDVIDTITTTKTKISNETIRCLAVKALALTSQDWKMLGQGDDKNISEQALFHKHDDDDETKYYNEAIERITSLLFIRIVAVLQVRQKEQEILTKTTLEQQQNNNEDTYDTFSEKVKKNTIDISTSSICRNILSSLSEIEGNDDDEYDNDTNDNEQKEKNVLPDELTQEVLDELQQFVTNILKVYHSSTLPFHNYQRTVSVTVSCNKLIDLIVNNEESNIGQSYYYDDFQMPKPCTFGLRHDPILLFSLLFSSLIHDVNHKGVKNNQLIIENDPLSMLYNDQSIQEKHSIHIGFTEFLKYNTLKSCIFNIDQQYRYFRNTVISTVLSTDITNPEQMVITKAKWKEAFENYYAYQQQQYQYGGGIQQQGGGNGGGAGPRRNSLFSNISMPRYNGGGGGYGGGRRRCNRRGSNYSEMSDITTPDFMEYGTAMPSTQQRRYSNVSINMKVSNHIMTRRLSNDSYGYNNATAGGGGLKSMRRLSNDSNGYGGGYSRRMSAGAGGGAGAGGFQMRRMSAGSYSNAGAGTMKFRQQPRRFSNYSTESDAFSEFAADSVAGKMRGGGGKKSATLLLPCGGGDDNSSFASYAQDSVMVGNKKPKNGMKKSSYFSSTASEESGSKVTASSGNSPKMLESFASYAQDSVMVGKKTNAMKKSIYSSTVASEEESASKVTASSSNSPKMLESFASYAQDSVMVGKKTNNTMKKSIYSSTVASEEESASKVTASSSSPKMSERLFPDNKSFLTPSNEGESQTNNTCENMKGPNNNNNNNNNTQPSATSSYAIAASETSTKVTEKHRGMKAPTKSNESACSASMDDSFITFACESININQKRLGGAHVTRQRTGAAPVGGVLIIEKDDCNIKSPVNGRSKICNSWIDDDDVSESSFSLTPPSSDDEYEGRTISGIPSIQGPQSITAAATSSSFAGGAAARRPIRMSRRASTGTVESQFKPVANQTISEDSVDLKSYRRLTASAASYGASTMQSTTDSSRFRKRLGIRRSMDLSGEAIEIYSKRGSIGGMSLLSASVGTTTEDYSTDNYNTDEPDYMRASAVLEALLRTADAGHFFQNWNNMTFWTSRMFDEMTIAHLQDRGSDPSPTWFENQIRIIDSYLLPLAYNLDESGVFGEFIGSEFAQNIEDIKEHWLVYGLEFTDKMIEKFVEEHSE